MTPVKGVTELLASLKLPKSIVSNGPTNKILLNLELTDLRRFFPQHLIFSGHEFKKFKPDPYLFIVAAEQMEVQPENCIVIEDSAHGAKAAQAAGMTCYGYTEMTHPDVFIPYDAIPFSSMEEIRTIIA
jgi:phosphoglycolate phosphatase